ncbi:MAG: YqaA family protein [Chloroflexia bacterium]
MPVQEMVVHSRPARWQAFWRENGRYIVSFLASVFLTAAIVLLPLLFPVDYAALGNLGYLGVFLATLLPSATVIFPSPTLAAAFIAGTFLNPFLVGLLAGLGATLGEITGYMAGYGGSMLAARSSYYQRIRAFVGRYGLLAIVIMAFIPNPLFDLAGIASGATRIPLWRFLLACFVGKAARFVLIAYLGHWGVHWGLVL